MACAKLRGTATFSVVLESLEVQALPRQPPESMAKQGPPDAAHVEALCFDSKAVRPS